MNLFVRFGRPSRRGFTLIELLVVVLIIGILAAVALPQYQKAVWRSRYAQLQISTRAIEDAAERYYMANGVYPDKLTDLDIVLPGNIRPDSDGILTFGDYICYYYGPSSGTTQCTFCTIADTHIGYRIMHQTRKTYCQASETSEKEQALCLALGGKNRFSNGGSLYLYELP